MIVENPYHSYNLGALPEGCQRCVRGEKLVLFVTGLCPRRCYFCPVSDEKLGHDVCFANERKVEAEDDVLTEARLMRAQGAGITGGDPLAKLDRTVQHITMLKKEHGKEFHIHLYTSLNLVTADALQKLAAAGLDEIRFHLDLDSPALWERVALASKYSWKIGVELPVVPTKEKELQKIMDFIHDKVHFLTLNELEVADNSQSLLLKMGFHPKNTLSYAVQGSLETGLRLLQYRQEKKYLLQVHFCTAKLKDAVQLGNRLKREAQGMRKKFDRVSKEGLLIRGALYLPELVPGVGYRRILAACNKEPYVRKLREIAQELQQELRLQDDELFVDEQKPRILLAAKRVRALQKKLRSKGLVPAIVKEYPTADQLEIEVEMLTR